MIRSRRWAMILGAVLLGSCGASTHRDVAKAAPPAAPDTLPPLDRPPLDPPIEITATFGEYRARHFHAGLDFSTEHRVGRPVFAPVAGYIERARTSGAGFGRSLMIHTVDGRTILLAHLDAFDEPLASYVAAVQDSTGEYEQELSPSPNRFPVQVGQRIAWTGESGAGPPHLHMEVRYGDMAYNPLRHGLTLPDSFPPVIQRVILEPIDDRSSVEGVSAPHVFVATVDTIHVEGRARVWIEAADGVSDRWPRDAPYALSMTWKGASVECRFDRIAWDEDMDAAEWVYDGRGTISPRHPLALWTGPGFRPTMLTASGADAGVVAMARGETPETLTLAVRDAAGNRTEARIAIAPPSGAEAHRQAAAAPARSVSAAGTPFEILPVQGPFVRIRYTGLTHGSRDLALGLAGDSLALEPATLAGRRWSAIVRVPNGTSAVVARGTGPSGAWEERRALRLVPLSPDSPSTLAASDGTASYRWTFPRDAAFSPSFVVVDSLAANRGSPSLSPLSSAMTVGPPGWPLRRPARIEVTLASEAPPHTDLYVSRGGSWTPARSETAAAATGGRTIVGETYDLGRTAVFQDLAPPRIGLARPVRIATTAPDRWALQCHIVEVGSGLDVARTYFLVDGRRAPSEWDAEHGVLRWRPLHAPAAGAHHYEVAARDRAGLESRSSGRFVVR